jgi:hypothetical protein
VTRSTHSTIVITGLIGLLGAILTGTGEFLMHFDPLARFDAENSFFLAVPEARSTLGHFIAVLGAPLYFIGCWHIRLMLRPAGERASLAAFLVGLYGFGVGLVWIGSRTTLGSYVNMQGASGIAHLDIAQLITLYDLRYESLITIVRIAVLLLSAIYIWLVLTGKSFYPRWMAIVNPILLIVASFVVFVVAPSIGKYLMPIALNVAFAIYFFASIMIARKQGI